jgi:hypothetical protein
MIYDLEDKARLQYGRLLWRSPKFRRRLLFVWEHPEHPHRERFEAQRELIVGLLECPDPEAYVKQFPDWSLRTMTREIPSVIWSLWHESASLLVTRPASSGS